MITKNDFLISPTGKELNSKSHKNILFSRCFLHDVLAAPSPHRGDESRSLLLQACAPFAPMTPNSLQSSSKSPSSLSRELEDRVEVERETEILVVELVENRCFQSPFPILVPFLSLFSVSQSLEWFEYTQAANSWR